MPDFSFLKGHQVQMYSAAWCGDCRNLKQRLVGAGLPYSEIDIESVDGAAEKLERETGKRAIPFFLIDSKTWVRGYHKELPGRLSLDVLERELRQALGA